MIVHWYEWLIIILITFESGLVIWLNSRLRSFKMPVSNSGELVNLPSVSVCIPARNERHALAACLERVVASDYEKLEILVLDDQSDDDTSLLIKSFAHAGVRFIAGKPLPKGWLGKNYALDTLAREASGDVLIFMDVDTYIKPATLSNVIRRLNANQLEMISVIPHRLGTYAVSMLLGHLRYMWEILLSTKSQPASASALWTIYRKSLNQAGNFSALAAHTQPEAVLAAMFTQKKTYRAVLDDEFLQVHYEKRWSSQLETSQRLLFPKLIASSLSIVLSAACFASWLAVLALAIATIWVSSLALWAVASYVITSLFFFIYARANWLKYVWAVVLLWPYLVLQELALLIASTLRYATHSVTWKGRAVRAQNYNVHYLSIDE